MAKLTPSEIIAASSETFAVQLPEFALPGVPEASELAGRYILAGTRHLFGNVMWRVEFTPCAGYNACELAATPNSKGLVDVRLMFRGGADRPTWIARDVSDLSQPLTLTFDPSTAAEQAWPDQLSAIPIASTTPPPISGPSVSSTVDTTLLTGACELCPCAECVDGVPSSWELAIPGVEDCGCTCTPISANSPYTLNMAGGTLYQACYQAMDETAGGECAGTPFNFGLYTCWFTSNYNSTADQCEFTLAVQMYFGGRQSADYGVTWSPDGGVCASGAKTLDLQGVFPGPCTGYDQTCDVPDTITMTPGAPYVLDTSGCTPSDYDTYVTCVNKLGCASTSKPPAASGPQCGDTGMNCCCASTMPAGWCSSGSCSVNVNPENGNLTITFQTPDGGPGAANASVTVHTSSGLGSSSGFGNGACNYGRNVVKTGGCDAQVVGCDGSVYYYTFRKQGKYTPTGNNTHTLKQNSDSTWLEQGEGVSWYYDTSGALDHIIDACGNRWTMVHSSPIKAVVSPTGQRTSFAYDGSGNIQRITDPYGRATTFVVSGGNITQCVTPELCETRVVYNSMTNKPLAVIDAQGCRSTFSFDTNGWCSGVQLPTGGSYAYSYPDFNHTVVTDPLGQETTMVFTQFRNLLSAIDPLGNRTTNVWANGLLAATIDPTSRRTTYGYTTLANATQSLSMVQNAVGRTTYLYDTNSFPFVEINPLGYRTTTIRDSNGQAQAIINPLGNRNTTVYDASGLPVARINPLGARTTGIFDSNRQRIAQIDALGFRTTYAYVNGQPIRSINALGNISTTIYDLVNNVLATIDPLTNRTTFVYSTGCQRIATIDPLNRRTSTVYLCNERVAEINGLGYRTTTIYDLLARAIARENPLGIRNTTVYDAAGRRIAEIDPLLNRSTSIYDAARRTVASINALNYRNTSVYDAAGRAVATINPLGNRATTVYNSSGQGIAFLNPLSNRTTSVYDAAGQMIATIDPLNRRTTTVYNSASQAIAEVNPLGFRTTSVYDSVGRVSGSIDPLTRRSTTVYNGAGQSVASIDPLGGRTTSVYDAAGRRIATIDPVGIRNTSTYDAAGERTQTINGRNLRTTYFYDAAGERYRLQSPRGQFTTAIYDRAVRQIATIDTLGWRTSTVYDRANRPQVQIDAWGNRTSAVYDAASQQISQIAPNSTRTTTVYDAAGQPIAMRNQLDVRTTTIYDAAGRNVATIDGLDRRTSLVYDAASQNVARIDARNRRTTSVYDGAGRSIIQINALTNRVTTVYDAASQVQALMDSNSNRTSYSYDRDGRKIRQTDGLNRHTTSMYDAAGRQTGRIDARENRTTYQYDDTDNVIQRRYPDGSRVTFAFDADNNRKSMNDLTGLTQFGYTLRNELETVQLPAGPRTTYTWSRTGQREQMNTLAGRFTYVYDTVLRRTLLVNPQGDRTSYAYDNANRRTSQRLANTTRTTYQYDNANQTTRLANVTDAGVTISAYSYRYDAASNRIGVTEDSGDRVTWVYDAADQLLAERRSGANAYARTYVYDPASNRTLKDVDGIRTTYTYDAANQLLNADSGSRTTYSFDNDGNQHLVIAPSGGRQTVTWNYENQPTLYQQPDATRVTMAYNANNRRMRKASQTATTHFLWDHANDSYLAETDDSGNFTVVYTVEPDTYGRAVSQRRGNASSYFAYDGLGSTRQLTSPTGITTDADLYDAFGNVLSTSGGTSNPFRWIGAHGYYWDSELISYYVRARVYDPDVMRWTSIDPRSRYARQVLLFDYSGNSPIGAIDPSGEDFIALAQYHIGLGFYHYSLEYWTCSETAVVGTVYTLPVDFMYIENPNPEGPRRIRIAVQSGSFPPPLTCCSPSAFVELVGTSVSADVRVMQRGEPPALAVWNVPISVVVYDVKNHGPISAVMPLLDGDVDTVWDQVIVNARNYAWAEQEGFRTFVNWPRSLYMLNGTNSRTFVVQMVRSIGIAWRDIPTGTHPGNDNPVQNRYPAFDLIGDDPPLEIQPGIPNSLPRLVYIEPS